MKKTLKTNFRNAIIFGVVCSVASLITHYVRGGLNSFTFINFILPTFFSVSAVSFIMDRLFSKK